MEGLHKLQRGLGKTLAGSLILHVIVISAGVFLFNAGSRKEFFAPVYTVDLIAPGPPGPRAETVNEPESDAPKTPEAKTKENTAEIEAAKKETVKIQKKTPKDAASLYEALKRVEESVKKKEAAVAIDSRIREIRKKQEAESRETGKRLEELKKEIGSKTAKTGGGAVKAAGKPGTKGGGTTGGKLKSEHPAYYSIIHDKVQEQWIYPEGFELKKISIIVGIRIDKNGKLLELAVEQSSGNKRFDESLLNAVKKAEPFPPLPRDFEGKYLETGLRFCPGCTE